MNKILNVSLAKRSYPIAIGLNLLSHLSYFKLQAGQRVLIVTNHTIAPFYLAPLSQMLQDNDIVVDNLILKDGEQFKNLESWNTILTHLLTHNHTRNSVLIALGGGVIGDLVGFAASAYQRGIKFVQVPTTLLSQVDSSVGGKTAINHPLGKNMIGAFYQPQSVVIDINCLTSLPMRELSSGLAEVIKYGIILDADFFVWLEAHIDDLMQLDADALSYCIYRCCQIKAHIVAEDETEQGGRALLNLGHTFGHAIETELGYGNWLHGEAVSVGMLMAAHTANLLGLLPLTDVERIKNLLQKAHLPVTRPLSMQANAYIPHMLRDKKVLTNQIRLVLPTAIGSAIIKDGISDELLLTAINRV